MAIIIALDAGHLESGDSGAVGNNLKESDLTGNIRERVVEKLFAYDCLPKLVPRTDSLQERCAYANNLPAAAFVSIHINASDGRGTGFESYVYPSIEGQAAPLADAIHKSCMAYMSPLGIVDRGKKFAAFAVLKNTAMPAVLLECLFIDNLQDASWLKNDSFLDGLSNAITWGIVQALGLKLAAPDPLVEAVRGLQAKGVIASPDYWLACAVRGGTCNGEFVAQLIRNFADKI